MSVQIRLRRVGRKAQPYYRVVVTDSRAPRGGAYLDSIGFYNPRSKPAELRLDLARVDEWVAKGAGMSETVASLVRKARRGGDRTVELKPMAAPPAPAAQASPAVPAAAAPGAPVDEAGSGEPAEG